MKVLQRIDLSFRDSTMNQSEIGSNLLKFFNLMKEVPQVKLAKVFLKTITLEEFTAILVDNHQTSKITDLLEFRVDKMKAKT